MVKRVSKKKLYLELSELLNKQFRLKPVLNQAGLAGLETDPLAQQRLLNQVSRMTALIRNPKAKESFLRSYLRIAGHKINKDGRHGSVVMEITKRCNQRCRHCYSRSQISKSMKDASIKRIIDLVRHNYKHIFITGGEPTLDERVLAIAKDNPDIMFFMFTNGAPIGPGYAQKLVLTSNLVPVLSIDGDTCRGHDHFKGRGSFKRVMRAIKALNTAGIPWGYLSMVTNLNARQVLSKKFVKSMKEKGAVLARYLEYIPVGPDAQPELVPSAATYYLMEKRKQQIIKDREIYMQETAQKKCLGLIFFDVDGNIKCCPFFHYAKHNIAEGDIERLIKDSLLDWQGAKYRGECPVYSDPEGLRAYLLKHSWKPTVSSNRQNSINSQSARRMADNYRGFLKIKAEKNSR